MLVASLLQRARHVEGMGAAFQLAGPGDDRELPGIADLDRFMSESGASLTTVSGLTA